MQVGIVDDNSDESASTDGVKWNSEGVGQLLEIAKKSQGLSGRSLRKLPLLAHAWFVHNESVDLPTFLDALDEAVDKHRFDTITMEKPRKM